LSLGHEGGACLLPASDEADLIAMLEETVQRRQKTLTRHAEGHVYALRNQSFDQGMASGS
jgi:hypothetical protein